MLLLCCRRAVLIARRASGKVQRHTKWPGNKHRKLSVRASGVLHLAAASAASAAGSLRAAALPLASPRPLRCACCFLLGCTRPRSSHGLLLARRFVLLLGAAAPLMRPHGSGSRSERRRVLICDLASWHLGPIQHQARSC
ncbi:hypothetical protein FA09DRAFT_216047 [Tilletiopsis washingtonensis]|uniref:Uncharacterized protein n=1 Tax=Tilletiopsis washingtonensis TaxID=58919 RepID=A0A316ZHE7_9BASI|nr:hypothetical protein FA09DRAFT_216047 [Tilletiopsis washingtonensis]PWN99703.1 hypothetical protein FA09DRAFT_216047 [Tilletiopsis washingtonensis]